MLRNAFARVADLHGGGRSLAQQGGGGERVMHPPALGSAVAALAHVKYGKCGAPLPPGWLR